MHALRLPVPAIFYFCVAALVFFSLNLVPLAQGKYHLIHLIYGAALLFCLAPMFFFLANPRERIPFFQTICLIYALQYTVFPFLGLSPWKHFEYLKYKDLVFPATLILLGISAMVLGYYLRPINLLLRAIPAPTLPWEPRRAKMISLIFLGIGFFGLALIETGGVVESSAQIFVFLSNLAVVGMLALFVLQLRGQTGRLFTFLMWFGYFPAYLGISIAAGVTGPIALLGIAIILTYIGERKRIPWSLFLVAVIVLLPFMYAKNEYRNRVWDENQNTNFTGVGQAFRSVGEFSEIATEPLKDFDKTEMSRALHAILIRFDISYIMGHVTALTPRQVPYIDGESYSDVLWKLIPRFFVPDKPNPNYGQVFGHMYQILQPNDFNTSINFPQLVEFYVNYGPWGVIIGMFLLSQIYWIISHFMNQPHVGDWMMVFAVSIFAGLFRIESNFSLVVAGIFYHVILLYILGFFIRSTPRRGV